MKNYFLFLVSLFFLSSIIFAQEVARKPIADSSEIHSQKPKAKTEVYSEPKVFDETPDVTNTPVNQEIQFSMAGILLGSLQNWNDLHTDKSKLGVGFNGDLFAGIIWEDMYFGIGPHLGYNFWTYSETVAGITASATTDVTDLGLDLGAAWEGFYMTLGFGAGNTSVTGSVGGESQTVEMPGSIDYTRVGFGWYDGFAVGIAFMNYSDAETPNNLNRFEFNVGWAF